MNASDEFILAVTGSQNRLYAYILSLMADPHAAFDVLQETNLVLLRKASEFREGAEFAPWAFRIAYFQILAYLRDRKRDRLVFDEVFLEQFAPEAAKMADEIELRKQWLNGCIEQLADEHRKLLSMRYTAEYSIEELAKKCSKSVASIKQVLYRIRGLLSRCVEQNRANEGAI